MTNEALAQLIKNGHTSAIAPLWEALRLLLYRYANQYISIMGERCAACGVTVDDLIQESYFAMLDAVKAWSPESGNKLTSYLKYPIKNRFGSLCGLRERKREPLNQCLSLDAPASGEFEDITLRDTVCDTDADNAFTEVEDRIYNDRLRNDLDAALDSISPDRAETVRGEYFHGLTLKEQAERENVSIATMQQRRNNGIRDMRRGKALARLKAYRETVIARAYYGAVSSFRHTHTSSTELAALRLEEIESLWKLGQTQGISGF